MPEFIGSGDKIVLIPDLDELPPFFPPDAEGLFQVIEIRDGKIVRMRDFTRRDEALEEAGLCRFMGGGPCTISGCECRRGDDDQPAFGG